MRSRFVVLLRAIACTMAACMLLVSCGRPTSRDTNTLVVLQPGDANTMNPLFSNNEPSFIDWGFILEPLVAIGEKYKPIPWLATSWTHSNDGLHWIVHVRHGVTWSDGAPFTARDVVFSWQTMLNPKTGFLYLGQYDYIAKVSNPDEYTVRFDLKTTNALFVSGALNSPMLPEHILGKYRPEEQRSTSFGEHPIGTGPYMLASWQHDQEKVFVANDHWWHGPISVRRIEEQVLLDDQARLEAMETSLADIYYGVGGSSYQILQQEAPHLGFLQIPDLFDSWVMPNLGVPGLHDRVVRQSMLYGWDREALVQGLLHGTQMRSTGVVPPGLTYWYDPHVETYAYDPAHARALLDAAGWKPGSDGVREKGGARLEFTLLMPSADAASNDLAAEFQADMHNIGIAINVEAVDYATFIDRTNDRKFDLAFTGWGGVPDPDMFTLLQSKQVPPGGNNDMGYSNATVDHDVTEGLRLIDDAKRKVLYDQMQVVTAEDPPELYAYSTYFRIVYNRRVHFDVKTALPTIYFWRNVWQWKLDPL